MRVHHFIMKIVKTDVLRISVLLFLFVMAYSVSSAHPQDTVRATPAIKKPTKGTHYGNDEPAGIITLDDIIAQESKSKLNTKSNSFYYYHQRTNSYINIFYSNGFMRFQKISSTEAASKKYDNSFGIGLQCGHIYNLNRRPIGNLFFGIDLSLIDFSVNTFKRIDEPIETILSENGGNLRDIPLNHSKTSIDYGISAGPSIMLYPFVSLIKLDNPDFISTRFQLYYHLGYDVNWVLLKDAYEKTEKIWGHGFYSCIGANISWRRFGIGYEFRNNSKRKFKPINADFSTNTIKADQQASRFYLQFRF